VLVFKGRLRLGLGTYFWARFGGRGRKLGRPLRNEGKLTVKEAVFTKEMCRRSDGARAREVGLFSKEEKLSHFIQSGARKRTWGAKLKTELPPRGETTYHLSCIISEGEKQP